VRFEYATEPFGLDEVPPPAVAAPEATGTAGSDAADIGAFGATAEGDMLC
jgi:hypothetical protein